MGIMGGLHFQIFVKGTEPAKVNGVFAGNAGYDNLVICQALIFVNYYCNLSYRVR